MKRFKAFVNSKRRKKRKVATVKPPVSYAGASNYINTPPRQNPPRVGDFSDTSFPGYPSS